MFFSASPNTTSWLRAFRFACSELVELYMSLTWLSLARWHAVILGYVMDTPLWGSINTGVEEKWWSPASVNQRPTAMRYTYELRSRAERQEVWPKPKHWKQKRIKSKCPCVNISVVRARLASVQNQGKCMTTVDLWELSTALRSTETKWAPIRKFKKKKKRTKPPIYMHISIHLLFIFFHQRWKSI